MSAIINEICLHFFILVHFSRRNDRGSISTALMSSFRWT